ncbi:hypothetical protein HZS_5673 [Henneguya salminicola]|nr:hypothetical protein HZS_5673 [Henneguya salminicola]
MTNVASINTSLDPDTCAWVKNSEYKNFIVCGCYKLLTNEYDNSSVRIGSLLLYKLENNALILLDVLKYNSGVLSLQFIENSLKFVAALSSGSVGLFHIAKNKKIKLLEEVCIKTNEELCLNIYEVNNIVWFTTSNGNVGTCVLTNSGISKQNVFQSDDKYESWSVISHEFEPNIGYSCSDDGLIHIWDVRIQKKSGSFNKYHDYGVCSLSWPNPQNNCDTLYLER